MAKYVSTNDTAQSALTIAATYKTQIELHAATGAQTLARGWIFEASMGPDGAPSTTDCSIGYALSPSTAAGTGTAFTAVTLDTTDDPAAAVRATININHSAEPTYSPNKWYMAINQRNSFVWQCVPGSELIFPATNLAGLGLRARSQTTSGYTNNVSAAVKWFD